MITIHEILKATSIESRQTLTRWRKSGLIPNPEVATHPSGRGTLSYWPDWVLGRCQRILKLKRQGLSLDTIKKSLGMDWQQEERLWESSADAKEQDELPRSPKSDVSLAVSQRRQLFKRVWKRVKSTTGAVGGAHTCLAIELNLASTDVLDLALDYCRRGYNMFLIFNGLEASISPDFGLGKRLAENSSEQGSFLVVPLWNDMRDLAADIGVSFPDYPSLRPGSHAEHLGSAVAESRDVQILGKNEMNVRPQLQIGATPIETSGKRRSILRKRPTKKKG